MASIVYLSSSNQRALEINEALGNINSGIAKLREFDGLRGEAIAAGPSVMASVFGVADDTQAQALNDRWANFLGAMFNSSDDDYAAYGKLRDLLNATVQQ
jgi:hypothetical protein